MNTDRSSLPRSRGISRTLTAVSILVVVVVAGSSLWYVWWSTTPTTSTTTGTLSFSIEGATATYYPTTKETNITVVLQNTGSVPIRLGGTRGVPPPSGTSLVAGSFRADFYSSNGALLAHHSGGPPDTANGGWIHVTYLVTGASPGAHLTINSTFNQGGLTASATVTFTVIDSGSASTTQYASSTRSSSTSAGTGSTGSSTSVTSVSPVSTSSAYSTSSTSSTTTFETTTSALSTSETRTTTTTTSSTVISTTKSSTSATSGTLSFRIAQASGVYDSSTRLTTIRIVVIDTGSISLRPKAIRTAPAGTQLTANFNMTFYNANGTEVYPCGCGHPPDTANGGKIIATFTVTGATEGETLMVTYTFHSGSLVAGPESASFVVT